MMDVIKTRPSYPADRKTFAIKTEKIRNRKIPFISFNFNPSRRYDINFFLEDKKRKDMNYFLILKINKNTVSMIYT